MKPLDGRPPPQVGDMLRWWRERRGLSQMKLAHSAGISPRHMSFVETGRSRPGRDVLARLAEALDLPFRERNALLERAGYSGSYPDFGLDEEEVARLRQILELVLKGYEPYGAVVVNAEWEVLMANRAHSRLGSLLLGEEVVPARDGGVNLLLQLFRPGGFRERLINWQEVSHHILRRVRRQVADNPTREGLRALLEQLEGFDLPPEPKARPHPLPVLPMRFLLDDAELSLVSLITTFGAPQDAMVQEMRVEAFLPADEESDALLRSLAEEE